MQTYLLTPPATEPVTIADARTAARLEEGALWDAILTGAIPAARAVAEHETGRHFIEQTWRVELAEFPAATDVLPFLRPTAVAVSYWDGSAYAPLTDETDYAWSAVGIGVSVVPALGTSWPALGQRAIGPRVLVDVTVGAATADGVPPEAVQFIKALVTLMVHDPSLTATQALDSAVYLRHTLNPLRLYR